MSLIDDSTSEVLELSRFFQRYDSLASIASTLTSDQVKLCRTKSQLRTAERDTKKAQKDVDRNSAFIQEQQDRIQLVSTHWFFGTTAFQPQLWFRGGCEGKIQRAQVKLEQATTTDRPQVLQRLTLATQKEQTARHRLHDQQIVHDRSLEADSEMNQMKEHLVGHQYPSPHLMELQSTLSLLHEASQQASTVQNMIESRKSDAHKVRNLLHQTQSLLQQAQSKEQEADSLERDGVQYKYPKKFTSTHTQTFNDGSKEVVRESFGELRDYVKYGPDGRVVSTNRPCPNGCGYVVTFHGKYCCGACGRTGGCGRKGRNGYHHHGSRCQRLPLSSQQGAEALWKQMQKEQHQHQQSIRNAHDGAEADMRRAQRTLEDAIGKMQNLLMMSHGGGATTINSNTKLPPTYFMAPPPVMPTFTDGCFSSSGNSSMMLLQTQVQIVEGQLRHYRVTLQQYLDSQVRPREREIKEQIINLKKQQSQQQRYIEAEKDAIFERLRERATSHRHKQEDGDNHNSNSAAPGATAAAAAAAVACPSAPVSPEYDSSRSVKGVGSYDGRHAAESNRHDASSAFDPPPTKNPDAAPVADETIVVETECTARQIDVDADDSIPTALCIPVE